jgi:hypothetical protein
MRHHPERMSKLQSTSWCDHCTLMFECLCLQLIAVRGQLLDERRGHRVGRQQLRDGRRDVRLSATTPTHPRVPAPHACLAPSSQALQLAGYLPCNNCAAGEQQPLAGQAACEFCPTGAYNNEQGEQLCGAVAGFQWCAGMRVREEHTLDGRQTVRVTLRGTSFWLVRRGSWETEGFGRCISWTHQRRRSHLNVCAQICVFGDVVSDKFETLSQCVCARAVGLDSESPCGREEL